MDFEMIGWILLFCGLSISWTLQVKNKTRQWMAPAFGLAGFVLVNFL